MDPEFKAKWLAGLRSGEYEQGRGALRRQGYCCWGVACDLIDPSWIQSVGGAWRHDGMVGLPSIRTAARMGLTDDITILKVLSGMNDQGKTFLEIADYIEEHL